jgi:hypothetical protein
MRLTSIFLFGILTFSVPSAAARPYKASAGIDQNTLFIAAGGLVSVAVLFMIGRASAVTNTVTIERGVSWTWTGAFTTVIGLYQVFSPILGPMLPTTAAKAI